MPDIKLNVNGPASMTPIGFSITYAVNSVPVCLIDLDPVGSTILLSADQNMRKPVTLTCTVKSDTGLPTASTSSIRFDGLFDGVSPSQSVGSAGYSAVVKGKAQYLVESYTKIPGLSPFGLQPFARVNNFINNLNGSDATCFDGLQQGLLQLKPNPNQDVLAYYLQIVKSALQLQATGAYQGLLSIDDLNKGIAQLLLSPKIMTASTNALNLLNSSFNTDAIAGIDAELASATNQALGMKIIDMFINGPGSVWENLLNFYSMCGCNLVCGNKTIWVVPDNGFLKFDHSGYSPHASGAGKANTAMPADYSQYSFNSNGYRDVGSVVIVNDLAQQFNGFPTLPLSFGGKYTAPESEPGAAVIVLNNHPFAFCDGMSALHASCYRSKLMQMVAMTQGTVSHYGAKKSYGQTNTTPGQVAQTIGNDHEQIVAVASNFAHIKYLQLRYGDRIGTIIMSFNTHWVPGTCGTLYINTGANAGTYLDFMVQSVTHRVSISAPTNGTSMTVVSFSCGRVSTDSVTVPNDEFFNYDSGKMAAIQSTFISEIGA